MSAFVRRITLRTRTTLITSQKYFGANISKEKSNLTKSIASKYSEQMIEQEKFKYKYKTRERIQNPSAYQHVKLRFRQCNTVNDVMKIMFENKKCEDVQVGTAAIKTIKIMYENKKVSREVAMKQIDSVWEMMDKYVVGMDCVAYNEYFHVCTITRFNYKCRDKFDEMCKNNILPNLITLKMLLKVCLKQGGTKLALQYWKTIVIDMEQPIDAECWAGFLAVCAAENNAPLAEECFRDCPYKEDMQVCYRMMLVYEHVGDLDKVLEMRKYMEQSNIEIDARIYNSISYAYRHAKQFQEAINTAKEGINAVKWDVITIKHLFEAIIGLIQMTNDFRQRKELLKYIENDIADYFKQAGDADRLQSSRHGRRMLDAYVSTYREMLGPVTFMECCNKYCVQYWEHDEHLDVPTLDLFGCTYSVAKAILEYVFDKELDLFRDSGLNIIIMSERDRKQHIDNAVNAENVNSILSSWPNSIVAIQKEPTLLYISKEQTKTYNNNNDDEPLFG
eukprot:511369_1